MKETRGPRVAAGQQRCWGPRGGSQRWLGLRASWPHLPWSAVPIPVGQQQEVEKGMCVNTLAEPASPGCPAPRGRTAEAATWFCLGELSAMSESGHCPVQACRAPASPRKPEPGEGSEAALCADEGLSACPPGSSASPHPCLPQPLGLPLAGPEGPCS